MKNILVTGCSGFIGYHICNRLLKDGNNIIGIDSMENNYDPELKKYRLNLLKENNNFTFYNINIENIKDIEDVFNKHKIDIVLHLAAKAGVRTSDEYRREYLNTNVIGFFNMLELSSKYKINHYIYSSSSAIYGDNKDVPYKETANTDYPISIYAATKKCDEILTYTYSKNYDLTVTGLRFFSVYGPLGRPDMGYYKFVNMIRNKGKIELYNNGDIKRDFTYIDDIVEGLTRVIYNEPKEKFNIYNLGNETSILIKDLIIILSEEMKKEDLIDSSYDVNNYFEYHKETLTGDVYETYSNTSKFYNDFEFKPGIVLREGLNRFVKWYKEYYKK